MNKRVKLPYVRAQTSKKDLATPPSSPNVGTIGHYISSGKLCHLTRNTSQEHLTCNTEYVVAV